MNLYAYIFGLRKSEALVKCRRVRKRKKRNKPNWNDEEEETKKYYFMREIQTFP